MTANFNAQVFTQKDEFVSTLAAGSVNTTLAEPGGQVRTVIDTESKLSIASGKLTFAGGKVTPAYGDPGFWLPSVPRSAGLVLMIQVNFSVLSGKIAAIGFDDNQSGHPDAPGWVFNGVSAVNLSMSGAVAYTGILPAPATATDYIYCVALRAAGAQFFSKSGLYFLLDYMSTSGSASPLYPTACAYSATFTCDYMRVFATFLAAPLASDSFSLAALAITDGAGQAEISGPGSGGGGVTWTQRLGTWAASAGQANAATLSGGVALATVTVATFNVLIKVKLTRSAGSGGLVVRYVDANNYVYLAHDGTNLKLVKRVAGTETTVVQTAIAYSAGKELVLVLTDTKFRGYYNDTVLAAGTEYTIADAALQTGTICGLYTTDTGNTFDDFVVYARGTNNEYVGLSNVGTLAAVETLAPAGALVKKVFKAFSGLLSPVARPGKLLAKAFTATLGMSANFVGTALPFLRRQVSFLTWNRVIVNEAGVITQPDRDFAIYAGDTVAIDGQVRDYANVGVNITGCTFRWGIRKETAHLLDKASSNGGIFIMNALYGIYQIRVQAGESAQLLPGTYYHECEMTDLAGNITTVMSGKVVVYPSRV